MWFPTVFTVIYLTAVFATLDAQSDLFKPVLKLESHQQTDVFEDENVELLCDADTGNSDFTVTWYRNKEQLQDDSVVGLAPEDTSLNITAIRRAHQGGYTCQIHLESRNISELSNTVNITVYEIPVPSLRNLTWTDVFHGETVEMSCGMTDGLAWTYTWYKDGQALHAVQGVSFDTNKTTLFISSASDAFKGEYKCKGHLNSRSVHTNSSSGVILSIYENKPEPSMTLQPDAEKVYIGERVSFKCEIKDSAGWEYVWFKDENQIPSTSNLFDIPHARLADSGTYTCMGRRNKTRYDSLRSDSRVVFISEIPAPEVKKQMPWSDVFPTESVSLSCEMDSSSDWMFTWYKDGQEVHAVQGVSFDTNKATLFISSASAASKGEYKCKGHLNSRSVRTNSSSGVILSVYDEIPKATLTRDPEYKVMFPGESVVFNCHINVSSGWEYVWTKDMNSLIHTENRLTINLRESSDQGSYECQAKRGTNRLFLTAKSQAVNIMVDENKPEPSMTLQPDAEKVYIGEPLSFKCEIKDSASWEYVWFKDGNQIPSTSNLFDIPHARLADSGTYTCMGRRNKTRYDSLRSDSRVVFVSGIPAPEVKKQMPWSDVFPTEGVSLSCEMDSSSDWMFTWYKDGQEVHAVQGVSFDTNKATLFISSASAAFKGEYKCKGHLNSRSVRTNSSSGVILSVYDEIPKVTLTRDPEYKVMFPGESVNFSCHINVSSGWEYVWTKDMNSLIHTDNRLTINFRESSDQGSYECQAKRGTNRLFLTAKSQAVNIMVDENKPEPSMTLQPDAEKVYIGEPLSFKCEIKDSASWEYVWFKYGNQIPSTSNLFDIPHARLADSGTYTCMGRRNKTRYDSLRSDSRVVLVSEIPSPKMKKRTSWLHVFPTESVSLSCEMDSGSDWMFTWYKDGQALHADKSVSFHQDSAVLSINSASASHRGQYSCSGKHKQRSVNSSITSGLQLDVYDTKPRVQLIQSPNHTLMHTEDSVSFLCHINVSTGWEFLWYKDDSPITVSGNNLTISSVLLESAGSYKCKTRRGTSHIFFSDPSPTITLTIEERPKAQILLLTGWSQAFSTDSLVLSCRVQESQDIWNYTWFKDDQPVNQPPSLSTETYTVTPQDDPEQSLYSCRGIRNGRPAYSITSDQFKTKNLLLKRRVLLSIAGCIVFGISAVCLGCIILRVFRKPVKEEYKPEEADLFLRMGALKDSDDGPCPLVQYITESALNTSPKEEGENGTISSETPSPETAQDGPATTAESPDAMENNNGGLVSFKQ